VWTLIAKEKETGLLPEEKTGIGRTTSNSNTSFSSQKPKPASRPKMAEGISQQLRREIRERAGGRCECCLMPEAELLIGGAKWITSSAAKHQGATGTVQSGVFLCPL